MFSHRAQCQSNSCMQALHASCQVEQRRLGSIFCSGSFPANVMFQPSTCCVKRSGETRQHWQHDYSVTTPDWFAFFVAVVVFERLGSSCQKSERGWWFKFSILAITQEFSAFACNIVLQELWFHFWWSFWQNHTEYRTVSHYHLKPRRFPVLCSRCKPETNMLPKQKDW